MLPVTFGVGVGWMASFGRLLQGAGAAFAFVGRGAKIRLKAAVSNSRQQARQFRARSDAVPCIAFPDVFVVRF
jgi:hypothetical protein